MHTAPNPSVSELRAVVDSAASLRSNLTGGTRDEFARQNVALQLSVKVAELHALNIQPKHKARFGGSLSEYRDLEIARCLAVVERWFSRRADYLDLLTRETTAFASFAELIDAEGGYFPSLRLGNDRHEFLAKCYDEKQAMRGDKRRAVLS